MGWQRYFGQYATQWPAVLVSHIPGRPLWLIEAAYSLGVWSIAGAAFFLTWRWTKRLEIVVLEALSFLVVDANVAALIMGEHHTISLLVWPCITYAIYPRRQLIDRLMFLLACLVITRSYESALVALMPVLAIVVWRLLSDPEGERWMWLASSVLLLAGIGIGASGILFPRDAANAMGARGQITIALMTPFVLSNLLAIASVALAALSGKSRIAWLGCAIASVAVIAGAIFLP